MEEKALARQKGRGMKREERREGRKIKEKKKRKGKVEVEAGVG